MITQFNVSDLMPSDLPKDRTIAYYFSLSEEEIKTHIPQVWLTDDGYVLSDGNNYVVFHCYRGFSEIEVNYCGRCNEEMFGDDINKTVRDVKILKELGVESPYDLVKLVDWGKITASQNVNSFLY